MGNSVRITYTNTHILVKSSSDIIVPQCQLSSYIFIFSSINMLSTYDKLFVYPPSRDGGRFISPKDFEGFSRGVIIFTIDFQRTTATSRLGFVSVSVIVPFQVPLFSTTREVLPMLAQHQHPTRGQVAWFTDRYKSHKKSNRFGNWKSGFWWRCQCELSSARRDWKNL